MSGTFEWAIAVVTADRQDWAVEPVLPDCLLTLEAAGFPPPWIFAEHDASVPRRYHIRTTFFPPPRLGLWQAQMAALLMLLIRQPQAAAYMLIRDNVVFRVPEGSPSLCEYLTKVCQRDLRQLSLLSLYEHDCVTASPAGVATRREAHRLGGMPWIFSRESLLALLRSRHLVEHHHEGPTAECVVSQWLTESSRWPYGQHLPSLVHWTSAAIGAEPPNIPAAAWQELVSAAGNI